MQKVISFSPLANVVLCKPPLTWRASTRLIYTATLTLRNRFVELWPHRKRQHHSIIIPCVLWLLFWRRFPFYIHEWQHKTMLHKWQKLYIHLYVHLIERKEKPLVSLHIAIITSVLLSLYNICHLHLYSMWWWWILTIIMNKDLNQHWTKTWFKRSGFDIFWFSHQIHLDWKGHIISFLHQKKPSIKRFSRFFTDTFDKELMQKRPSKCDA